MDFAMLPPEINSGRLYAGAGAAPLLAAAAAWGGLASELASAAAEHTSVVTGLAAAWMGPSATAMAASAMTYTSWLTSTAEMATQTAAAASSAAAAFEAAFAATVPPPLIAANRAQLMALVATNFLGINTAAIMATEAQYAEMWAQDVAAMFGYQAESAAATAQLTQPTQAPQVTSILSWLTTPNSFLTALSNPATPLGFLEQQWLSQASSGPYQVLSYPLLMALMAQANGYMNRSNDLTEQGNSISDRLAQDDEQQLGHPSPVNPAESPTMPGNSPKVAERPEAVMGNARTAGALTVPPNWDRATRQVELAGKATPLPAGGGMGGMIPTPIAAVNAPERKQRNGNEVLVRVKFVPTSI